MNRHFYNFIAMFNAAAKTNRGSFTAPVRNKFTLVFLDFLLREGLINHYEFKNKDDAQKFVQNERSPATHPLLLGSKGSKFYVPVIVHLRLGLVHGISSVTTPGNRRSFSYRALARLVDRHSGANGVVVVSSSRLGRLASAKELLPISEGGLVMCVVLLH